MKKKVFGILLVVFLLGGCRSFQVENIYGKKVSGVTFKTNKVNVSTGIYDKETTVISNKNGQIKIPRSTKNGILSKEEYLSKYISSPYAKEYQLYKYEDFMKKSFIENYKDSNLFEESKEFINNLQLLIMKENIKIKLFSLDLSEHQGKKHLQIGFESNIVYNSIKLDKYAIGKIVYDEFIIKVLDESQKIDSGKIDWINISVRASSKNFVTDYFIKDFYTFEFIMKKGNIDKFKNYEITSQELLNRSIILMEGDRVELKLQ